MGNDCPVIAREAALDLASKLSQNTPPCEVSMSLSFRSYRGFPCVMRCDEQLWYVGQTTAFDPKQTYMTDRYQKGILHRSA